MKVGIFKEKFTDVDFNSEDLETAVEKFEDRINGYANDLENEGSKIIDIEFVFFEDGRAIAVMKYEEDY
ncbi:hypothetical protein ABZ559_05000 [Streptococcus sp. ZY19097]|uniref:hypothetical protein n=1 Tax=Streptococcus sp. ZY19097 TaxID=3231906 RepID=UPI0034597DBC